MNDDLTNDESQGCLLLVAFGVISFAVGTLTSEPWGWLVFGVLLLFDVLLSRKGD